MKVYNCLATLFFFFILSCNSVSKENKKEEQAVSAGESEANTYRYDLSKAARKWDLPPELKEISGNTWVDKDHLLAIEDLHPNLYLIRLDNKGIVEKTIPFETGGDKKFDIEDVALVDNDAYALWSHGVLFKITDWQGKEQTKEIPTSLDKKNNTEGLCYDPVTHNLLVACKNESGVEDAKKSARAIYSFDIKTEKLSETPFLMIEKKDFKEATGEKLDFYPSAIAVHPLTHDIYILSTKDTKALAQYSHDGKFKSVQLIDKNLMPQPEGICFSPDGVMYISTEGRHGDPPRIYEFDYAK